MCGIFAYLSDRQLDQTFETSFFKLQPRGPNNSKILRYENNLFGFHRLAINGLDEQSNQPFCFPNLICICNGEIYNYQILKQKYQLSPKTHSDCEIIPLLYHYFDGDFQRLISEIDGEFAFVLYDQELDITYIARDVLGVKGLFYGMDNFNNYIFSSEMKGLYDLIVNKKNIFHFPPGNYAILKNKNITFRSYFNLNQTILDYDYDYYTKQINSILTQKITKMYNLSDKKVGLFLSGGLDSSIVTSIVSRIDLNIPVFTISFNDSDSEDLIAAKEVVKYLGLTNHHVIRFNPEETVQYIQEVIKVIESYDITTVRCSILNYLCGKYIRDHTDIKVLLVGEVSDEIFGGYLYFHDTQNSQEFRNETVRLCQNLHQFDILRVDRCMSHFGLEARVPFASRDLVENVLNMPTSYKLCHNKIEKKILRDSFRDHYLPPNILNRVKNAFSDSNNGEKLWKNYLEEFCNSQISDEEFDQRKFLYHHNTPLSRESFYYRKIYEELYGGTSHLLKEFWLPKFQKEEMTDPSARATLKQHF